MRADVLGVSRKMMDVAIQGQNGAKEVMVSLELMKSWDILHESFPHKTIFQYSFIDFEALPNPPCPLHLAQNLKRRT